MVSCGHCLKGNIALGRYSQPDGERPSPTNGLFESLYASFKKSLNNAVDPFPGALENPDYYQDAADVPR